MVNAVFDPALFDPPAATERPLGVSMLASTLLHLLVIAALTSVAPRIALLPSWQGTSAPILVELQQPPPPAPEPPPEPAPVISVPEPSPLVVQAPPSEPTIKVPVPVATPSSATARPPLSIRAGPPNPRGSVAVGLLSNPEWVSTAVAARLAQRFPATPARAPKLNGAVITGYPAEAARAHQSARIAAVLTIDASGNIVERDTLLSPDDPTFRQAVLTALAGTRFTPAESDGKPVGYWAILEFVFDIDPLPGAAAQR
ncbi:MAG TPA: energy transducer TonB [Casimicrobiaceae bacterium]|nr:energy transducer TonB [Casimicrobiaceae bacterium]